MEWSSGIIFYRKNKENETEFFVCTPGGPFWKNRELWNFPKGHIEGDESPFQTAVREFKEETSIDIPKDEKLYEYQGVVRQNSSKQVHVFAKKWENDWKDSDSIKFHSNLCTSIYHGKEIEHPEISGYTWMTYSDLETKGMKCYLPIFKELSLND